MNVSGQPVCGAFDVSKVLRISPAAAGHSCQLHTTVPQALTELEYPEKLQKLLLTPEREVSVSASCWPACVRPARQPPAVPLCLAGPACHSAALHSRLWRRAPGSDHAPQVLVELVITRDDGEIETFNAYRVQHDNRLGPEG